MQLIGNLKEVRKNQISNLKDITTDVSENQNVIMVYLENQYTN